MKYINDAGERFINMLEKSKEEIFKAIPHDSARVNPEKIWVLMIALFRKNTLYILRKSDEIRAQIFQEAPK